MKGRDKAIVAVILMAALAVGLVTVYRMLGRAQEQRTALLATAQSNRGNTAVVPPGTGTAPEGMIGTETTPGDVATGGTDVGDLATGGVGDGTLEDRTASGGTAADGAADGTAAGTAGDTAPTNPAPPAQGGGTTATPPATTITAPGTGEKSLEELVAWTQTESGGAIAIQKALAAAEAVAAGVGSGDDALRRDFAKVQGKLNASAQKNLLTEEITGLVLAVMREQALLALQQESVDFYEELDAAVQAALKSDDGLDAKKTALLEADAKSVKAALEEAVKSMPSAKMELDTAHNQLNVVLGNPVTVPLTISGELKPTPLPAIELEIAVVQALDSRNEIRQGDYQLAKEEAGLAKLRYSYATTAPEYMAQQAIVDGLQISTAKQRREVEKEVRELYARLQLSHQNVTALVDALAQTGQPAPAPSYQPKENEQKEWRSELVTLLSQWADTSTNRQLLLRAMAQLQIDVLRWEHAISVGCITVAI